MKKGLAILVLLVSGPLVSSFILLPGDVFAGDVASTYLEVPDVCDVRANSEDLPIDTLGYWGPPSGEGDPDTVGDGLGGPEGVWDSSGLSGVEIELSWKQVLILLLSSSWWTP